MLEDTEEGKELFSKVGAKGKETVDRRRRWGAQGVN